MGGPRTFDPARAVADAILYEGYLLYPYRRSSAKNRVRWQFGVVAPRAWVESHGLIDDGVTGSAESWWQQTECLLEAPEHTMVHVRLRFLRLQAKCVEQRAPEAGFHPVDEVRVDGRPHFSFEEAVPREFDAISTLSDLLAGERRYRIELPGGEVIDALITPPPAW
jgi:hypothetical protein